MSSINYPTMLNRFLILIIILNSKFIFSLNNNEINGKFIYDVDIEKNELYVFVNEISLSNTYNSFFSKSTS